MVRSLCLCLALMALAAPSARAQYGGGGGTSTGGTGTSPSGGYGGGGKTAALVAAYAAGGTALYLYLLKRPTNIAGCVTESTQGLQIVNDKDKQTYLLDSPQLALQPGTRVEIRGKKSKYGATRKFTAKKLVREVGTCDTATAQLK
jgi:hypothetical protein